MKTLRKVPEGQQQFPCVEPRPKPNPKKEPYWPVGVTVELAKPHEEAVTALVIIEKDGQETVRIPAAYHPESGKVKWLGEKSLSELGLGRKFQGKIRRRIKSKAHAHHVERARQYATRSILDET